MSRFKSMVQESTGGKAQRVRIFLLVLAMVFMPVLFTAPAAHAGTYDDLTGSPGQECRPKSLGNAAGSGFPGLVDPAPRAITPANNTAEAAQTAERLQAGAENRIYHVYGWAGYNWEVCATGGPIKGGEAIGNTDAWSDSEIGSTMLKMATGLAALNSGIAKMAAEPGAVMAPLDAIVIDLSGLLKKSLVDLWLPIILVAAASMIAVNALNGNVRRAMASVAAILLSLVAVSFFTNAPIQVAQTMDGVASQVQTSILQQSQQFAGKEDVPADETWGVIYTEDIIFPLWAQGITNWQQDDPRLRSQLESQRMSPNIESKQKFEAFTPTRAYQIRAYPWDAEKNATTDNARRDAWNTIGEASQTKDAPTRAFTGQEENRAGTGFLALAAVGATASFSIPANLMIFFASIAFRLLPIVGMILALFMSFEPTRPMAYKMGRFFLACLVNGVILGVFAAVHLALVGRLFNSDIGFLWATVATLLISIIFFKVTKPVRSLTNTVVSVGKGAVGGMKRMRGSKATDGNNANNGNSNGPQGATPGARAGNTTVPASGPLPLKRQPAIDPPRKSATQRLIDTANPKVGMTNGALSGVTGAATGAAATAAARKAASTTQSRQKETAGTPAEGGPKTGKRVPDQPARSPKNAAQQQGYSSLQQAQASDAARSRQVRLFVPPNTAKVVSAEARTATQQGDRPAKRKFTPPAPPSGEPASKRAVEPLKANRS